MSEVKVKSKAALAALLTADRVLYHKTVRGRTTGSGGGASEMSNKYTSCQQPSRYDAIAG